MKKLLLSLFAMALAVGANAQTNLLKNGDFEKWTDGKADNWTTTSTAGNATVEQSTEAHGGTYAALVKCAASSNKRLGYNEITLKAGTYKFKFWAKGGQVRPGYVAYKADGTLDSSNYKYGDYATVSDWTEVSYEFTLEAQTKLCLVVMNPKSNTSTSYTAQDFLIDDASLTTTDGGLADGDDPVTPPTPEVKTVTVTEALAIINALADGGKTTEDYIISGTITVIDEISTQYGNATFDITDGTNTVKVFRTKDIGNVNFTDAEKIKVGDVVKVQGKLQKYVKNGETTPEVTNCYLLEITGTTGINNATVKAAEGAMFNLAGQKVNADYKGVVIMNGKKVVRK